MGASSAMAMTNSQSLSPSPTTSMSKFSMSPLFSFLFCVFYFFSWNDTNEKKSSVESNNATKKKLEVVSRFFSPSISIFLPVLFLSLILFLFPYYVQIVCLISHLSYQFFVKKEIEKSVSLVAVKKSSSLVY